MSVDLRYVIVPVLLTLALFVEGCATSNVRIEPLGDLPPAALPDYRIGDRVVYSNGHAEEVVGVGGDKVHWRRDTGTEYTALRNFVLPDVDRQSGFKDSRWETEISVDDLWPLRTGEHKLVYRTRRYDKSLVVDSATTQVPKPVDLDCKSAGTARVRVLAGTFDTYRISCARFRMARGWQPYRDWYYAPSVGHYVLRVDYSSRGGFRRRLEMVAFLPAFPPTDAYLIESADLQLQQVLNATASGTAVEFVSPGKSNIRVVTTPLNTSRTGDGTYCRNFKQKLGRRNKARTRVGVACLEAGVWQIPGA